MPFKNKYEELLYCFTRISREAIGEEAEIIGELEEYKDIRILEKAAAVGPLSIELYVVEPFDRDVYKELEETYPYTDIDKMKKKGEEYMRYRRNVELWRVNDSISDDITYDCEIKDDDLEEGEWEEAYRTEEYKKAQVQVARELLGYDIAAERGL